MGLFLRKPPSPDKDLRTLAGGACLIMGMALLAWGIAPAVVERAVTGRAADFLTLGLASGSLLVGTTFIGLQILIARGARWALWAGLVLSTLIMAFSIGSSLFNHDNSITTFVVLLAPFAVVCNWLAIRDRHHKHVGEPIADAVSSPRPKR